MTARPASLRHRPGRDDDRQAAIGLSLSAAIVAAWLCLHVYGVFLVRWSPAEVAFAPLIVAVQCWLDVGLFIIAHDCMHGSLAPFRPAVNRWAGRLALALYAGFSYDRLIGRHFAHHRHSGTPDDPDFHAGEPRRFWPWYVAFFRRYVGWRELATLALIVAVYEGLLGAAPANVIVFWALPAILSSLQLFLFGTYLPHRHEEDEFLDGHNARSNDLAPWLSLLTCFHFGYHHEHHEMPHVPWWKLPAARRAAQVGRV